MHLLAAKPGGFVDDEGIVDLDQSPADLLLLSASDAKLSLLARCVEKEANYPSIRLANWLQLRKAAAFDLYRDKVLDQAKLVVVSLLGGSSYWRYGFEQLIDWAEGATPAQPRVLILVPGDAEFDDDLIQASNVPAEIATGIWALLQAASIENTQHLLAYLKDVLCQIQENFKLSDLPFPPTPEPVHNVFIYAENEYSNLPVIPIFLYRSHLNTNEPLFNAFLRLMKKHGLNPLAIAFDSLKDTSTLAFIEECFSRLREAQGLGPIINATGFSSGVLDWGVPILQCLLVSTTQDHWKATCLGLSPRDIAMQVALPEMDGRLQAGVLGFKAEDGYAKTCEINLVAHRLHEERGLALINLVKSHLSLSQTPNQQKRIGLILANYPPEQGRMGNGVGLDTPASTLNIIKSLKAAGFPVGEIPADSKALMGQLQSFVGNDPDTFDLLGCQQSLCVHRYQLYFEQLPKANQAAVLERWGPADQDPKVRNKRFMISGIRLGDLFVGVQAPRGFNLDLNATYHDPDLVPPHTYLAFYFWLRYDYGVSALVHVGKHGNLEWLPGKGHALSCECWPTVVLGDIPNVYPFIVNDPGEGAQAKRRTHAVIVDHLMPPMARAEVYGKLAEIEALADDYYQAVELDPKRAQWLREKIIQQVRENNILQELKLKDSHNEVELLNELDTYLCEIKEAQIRNGLHRLGELPEEEKLAETLVALLRLPRGTEPEEAGLLHALAKDLNLAFDPLDPQPGLWQSEKPEILTYLLGHPWRTAFDAREGLEKLALSLVKRWVMNPNIKFTKELIKPLPNAMQILMFAKHKLLASLEQSKNLELDSILKALSGGFVQPGPSGAPTRGRLDVLPTGRNFFSIDNRAIPTPAAWALGMASAQQLLDRHLQETGDFLTEMGLSVWGTATMRTGGDDIAQAFYLMGVKPIWAPGTNRVVDFEIIPGQILGRPRVDVTLRVSGFFRDAFSNVMHLFDAAVRALGAFEEPGIGNSIREHILKQTQVLLDQGVPADDAKRLGSYRVFSSKPGAYGAGLQGLIMSRCWKNGKDLAEAYLNWGGYAYGSDIQDQAGVEAKAVFAQRLSQLQAVVHNQDNKEHDLLDSDDYYQFQGGMSNAVKVLSEKAPKIYHADHANPAVPKVRTLDEALARVLRSRALNPKWISAMREHGYKGAFEMAATLDYLFAYDATCELVQDYQYALVAEALVLDKSNQAFLKEHNPSALNGMTERLLEAMQRGMWAEPGEYAEKLRDLRLQHDALEQGSV